MRESRVIPRQELLQEEFIRLIVILDPCKSHLLDEAVLEEPKSYLDPTLGLRRISLYNIDAQFAERSFYLCIILLRGDVVMKAAMAGGLKMAGFVDVEGAKYALYFNEAP